jgi:putative MFS transporter
LLAAQSRTLADLSLFRALSGLALGAYPPVAFAFLADVLPPSRRGLLAFAASGIGLLGPPLAILLVRWLTPLQPLGVEAWRWGFVCGGIGALLIAALFRAVPESPRWLDGASRGCEADELCVRFERSGAVLEAAAAPDPVAKADDGRLLPSPGRSAVVFALFLLSPWSTVAFPLLMGAVLAQKGFKITDTLLYLGLSSFGPIAGTLVASSFVDSLGRRAALLVASIAMAAASGTFLTSSSPSWLMASSVAFFVFTAIYIPTLTVYAAEFFPTQRRASSVANAWTFNRLSAAVAPLVLVPILRAKGPMLLFTVVGGALLAGSALLSLLPAGKQRRSLA